MCRLARNCPTLPLSRGALWGWRTASTVGRIEGLNDFQQRGPCPWFGFQQHFGSWSRFSVFDHCLGGS